jgi:hypothetical protein
MQQQTLPPEDIKSYFDNYVPPELTDEKKLIKWGPILDALNVKDSNLRQFMATYAEHHCRIEMDKDIYQSLSEKDIRSKLNGLGNHPVTFLPISLKLLSMLKLEGKNYFVIGNGKDTEIKNVSVSVTKEQINAFTESDMKDNIIPMIENVLINKLSEIINKELETHENFFVYDMVENISVIAVDKNPPLINLTSRYKIN